RGCSGFGRDWSKRGECLARSFACDFGDEQLEGAGLADGMGEAFEVVGAGNGDAAEASGDGGEHLDVKEEEAAGLEMLKQMKEGDLGGVGHAMEHGFAGKKAADGNAVNST